MSPKVLVLDEPTAGLDPSGRAEMMALFKRLHEKEKIDDHLSDPSNE